jgi:hypothetical protein
MKYSVQINEKTNDKLGKKEAIRLFNDSKILFKAGKFKIIKLIKGDKVIDQLSRQ